MDLKDLEIMDIRTLNKLRKDIIKIDRTIKTSYYKIDEYYLFCTACEECDSQALQNEIFICDICSTQVHQKCYGGDLLDFQDKSKNWICQRCLTLIQYLREGHKKSLRIPCSLCPEFNMMLRQVTIQDEQNTLILWVHLSCLSYVKSIVLMGDAIYKIDSVELLKNIDKSLVCHWCNQSEGFLQQCSFTDCPIYYHIGCAKTHGMIIQEVGMQMIRDLMKDNAKNFSNKNIYCKDHIINSTQQIKDLDVQIQFQKNTIKIMEYRECYWYFYNRMQCKRYNRNINNISLNWNNGVILNQRCQKQRQTRNSNKDWEFQQSNENNESKLENQMNCALEQQEQESFQQIDRSQDQLNCDDKERELQQPIIQNGDTEEIKNFLLKIIEVYKDSQPTLYEQLVFILQNSTQDQLSSHNLQNFLQYQPSLNSEEGVTLLLQQMEKESGELSPPIKLLAKTRQQQLGRQNNNNEDQPFKPYQKYKKLKKLKQVKKKYIKIKDRVIIPLLLENENNNINLEENKLLDENCQISMDKQQLHQKDNIKDRAPKKEKVSKTKLIKAYEKNLTSQDIINQIENLSIKDHQLDICIPKKFRYLRKQYENNLKVKLQQQLFALKKEFLANNKNEQFKNEQLYVHLDRDLCVMLFDEYYEIYNLEAFDLYVWSYLCFNGLLDQENRKLEFNENNETLKFWKLRIQRMGLEEGCSAIKFIEELRMNFMKIVSKIDDQERQENNFKQIFDTCNQILIID